MGKQRFVGEGEAGYVYWIRMGDTRYVKIGSAKMSYSAVTNSR